MHLNLKTSAPIILGALGVLALAAPAAAQRRGPPPDMPDIVNHNPILSADIGLRGPGSFTAVLDQAKGQLCYMIEAPALDRPTSAMIADASGKAVVKLAAPTGTASGGCAAVAADLGKALVANPGNYMVQVNTAAYPAGAASGKLSVYDPNKK